MKFSSIFIDQFSDCQCSLACWSSLRQTCLFFTTSNFSSSNLAIITSIVPDLTCHKRFFLEEIWFFICRFNLRQFNSTVLFTYWCTNFCCASTKCCVIIDCALITSIKPNFAAWKLNFKDILVSLCWFFKFWIVFCTFWCNIRKCTTWINLTWDNFDTVWWHLVVVATIFAHINLAVFWPWIKNVSSIGFKLATKCGTLTCFLKDSCSIVIFSAPIFNVNNWDFDFTEFFCIWCANIGCFACLLNSIIDRARVASIKPFQTFWKISSISWCWFGTCIVKLCLCILNFAYWRLFRNYAWTCFWTWNYLWRATFLNRWKLEGEAIICSLVSLAFC